MLEVLYQDESIVVINKPAGISVHPSERDFIRASGDARPNDKSVGRGKSTEKTIVDWILETYPEIKDVGEHMLSEHGTQSAERSQERTDSEGGLFSFHASRSTLHVLRPGIVHRLDKDTSGCLIIAKTQPAYEHLKKQFQEHTIEKAYHAFVYGWPKNTSGVIQSEIARSTSDIRKWTAGRGRRGVSREAISAYQILSRFSEQGFNRTYEGEGSTDTGTYSYVAVMPKTGRTHQIRVHMKYINHPIVCDSLYADGRPCALGFERQALHARSISFATLRGSVETVEAPFPEDFQKAILLAEKGVL